MAYERRSAWLAAAAGAVTGLAILGNSRLVLLPLVVAPYVAWRVRPGVRALAAGAVVLVAAAAVVAPWAIRNRVQVGCFAITTDARALWKANNENTYDVLAAGGWIDDVPELPGVPPWPERAAELGPDAARAVDECAQMRFYREQVTTSGASTRARRRASPPRRWGCCGGRRSRPRRRRRPAAARRRSGAGCSSRCT